MALATDMAVGMLLLTGIGYWVDRRRGGGVFWTGVGLLLGFAYGMYEAWKAVRAINAQPRGKPAAADSDRPTAPDGPKTRTEPDTKEEKRP
jgi:F0F1-type ATP synthase assembly protein I